MKTNHYPYGPKTDWARQAESIARGEIEIANSDIPMLLEWMRDMNWPGASTISSFIKRQGSATLEPLRSALQEGDSIWNQWLLSEMGDVFDAGYWKSLLPELEKVASFPDAESAHIEALIIISKHSLLSRAEVELMIRSAKESSGLDPENYRRLDEL